MKKATIYARFKRKACVEKEFCNDCPLSSKQNGTDSGCSEILYQFPDKANEIILNWCEEHPGETRQSKIQKIIPAIILDTGEEYVDICPNNIDTDFSNNKLCDNYAECSDCKKEYWLAEVDENE